MKNFIRMIQRLQTVYLLLTTILSGLFLTGDFIKFANPDTDMVCAKFNGIFRVTAENNLTQIETMSPVAILAVIIPALSATTIFFFKKRMLQMRLTLVILLMEILFIAAVCFYLLSLNESERNKPVAGFFTFIPLISIIFTILAYRGIRKDDDLVKSYERMR